ncbi:hypothetical protein [Tianweitania sp.]|uniref:hypothetical protein n=1 Tax=Tianweitania sp. TaxID=2021634 RepID=UPI00289A1010|nr:hypothetical protein [Tianweitania sp.]
MIYSSCLTEEDGLLVLDASVVINLLATGCALDVIAALSRRVVLPEAVVREVENGEERGHGAASRCRDLLKIGGVEVLVLEGPSLPVFIELVSGSASASLGDGEAATIALASTRPGCAVIDEKKATKLLTARFAQVRSATTIDLLAHAEVERSIGRDRLALGIRSALKEARMHVRQSQFDWVSGLIGDTATDNFPALRRFASPGKNASR